MLCEDNMYIWLSFLHEWILYFYKQIKTVGHTVTIFNSHSDFTMVELIHWHLFSGTKKISKMNGKFVVILNLLCAFTIEITLRVTEF